MGDSRQMFQYLGAIAAREGAFVIIPHNGAVKGLPENLREVPSTVLTPRSRRPREFAERGERGSWMLIWMPPDLPTGIRMGMTSTQLTQIVGDVIVILGLVLNYLKTRSVSNTVKQSQTYVPAPPKQAGES